MGNYPSKPELVQGKEFVYEQILELSENDILPQSGINAEVAGKMGYRSLLTKSIAEALKNPEWLSISRYSSEYSELEKQKLPRARYVDSYAAKALQSLNSEEEIQEAAELLEKGSLNLGNGMAPHDVIVRAFECMSADYPNFTFFRGAEFDPDTGFRGHDFAPGNLEIALDFYGQGFAQTERWKPVLAMLRVKDLVRLYTRDHSLNISTEGDWGRNSLEIFNISKGNKEDYLHSFILRKLPADREKLSNIVSLYQRTAIS